MSAAKRWLPVAIVTVAFLAFSVGTALAHGESTAPAQPAAASQTSTEASQPTSNGMNMGSNSSPTVKPAPPATTTTLTVSLKRAGDGSVQAVAQLSEASGAPVSGADVAFVRRTLFGSLDLGKAATDGDGRAAIQVPAVSGQQVEVTAEFAGEPRWKASQGQATLQMPPAAWSPSEGGLTTPYPNAWFVAVAIVVVGGIWGAYAVVFYTLSRLRKAGVVAPVEHGGAAE